MSENVISPWTEDAELQSPNGEYIGKFCDGWEIAMGAPSQGELWLKTKNKKDYKISNCAAASFIWSDDSEYIAYSEWTKQKKQIIRIIKIKEIIDKFIEAEFSVIQFTSFENGLIKGVDSPIYLPRKFIINIAEIDFAENNKKKEYKNK